MNRVGRRAQPGSPRNLAVGCARMSGVEIGKVPPPISTNLRRLFRMVAQGIFVVVGFIALIVWAIPLFRHGVAKRNSQQWPSVSATIETGEILRGGPSIYQALLYRTLLGYSYSVDGLRCSGLFVLIADDQAIAESLRKQLVGRAILVRYDPARPGVSFVVESELLDRQVIQNPLWLK